MKLFSTIILLFASVVSFSQDADLDPKKGPILKFEKAVHRFGQLTQGDIMEYSFEFRNTGNNPLMLSDVKTQCGCTAPEWKKDGVIAPGESGEILVRFDSTGKSGMQSKSITVYSNAQNNPEKVHIVGMVILPKKTEATGN